MTKKEKVLGDWSFSPTPFINKEKALQPLLEEGFQKLESRKRFKQVNKVLLELIQEQKVPCFLLPQVLDFIDTINSAKVLEEPFTFSGFEFWLNHFSKLSRDENLLTRSKIAGRHIPRNEYQVFFPVGLGKTLFGSHFVAAHLSPDVDTTVASFWGWLDAFCCRLAEGLHYWSLPKGLTDGHLKKFFLKNFHHTFFTAIPRQNPTIMVSATDMMTLKDYSKVQLDLSSDAINHGPEGDMAIVLINEEGMYKGEWRSQDAEATRQVLDSLLAMLRWFKNKTVTQLIKSLSKESTVQPEQLLLLTLSSCDVVQEMADPSKKQLELYMKKLLHLPKTFDHTVEELFHALEHVFHAPFAELFTLLKEEKTNRTHKLAMQWLENIVTTFEDCVQKVRSSAKKLRHLLAIKQEVLAYPTTFITLKSDIEEMRLKMRGLDHLTVVIQETNDALFPVGIVKARDLQRNILGTASLRDFSNLSETKAASYIDVASIIDHHKTAITTSSASTLLLADAQSTNTLLAEETLEINTQFSNLPANPPESSISYWVAPEREMLEYISQLFAILDDTDLLSKVSRRDVLAVIKLLNRMMVVANIEQNGSIAIPKVFDSYSRVLEEAQKLLRNKDLHSIYRKVYQHRESEVEETLLLASEKKPSSFFADTKEQNGCCRIGQTKLFASNLSTFAHLHHKLLEFWIEQSQEQHLKTSVVDFYLHMLSTIQGEAEVMQGGPAWKHKDEMWIYIPEGELPLQHLATFLSSFNFSDVAQTIPLEVEIRGIRAHELARIIENNLTKAHSITTAHEKEKHSVCIIRFPAGHINSRKTQITPFLPKIVL